MKWSAMARGSLAVMLLGALLPAAAAKAQLNEFCPVPAMMIAPVYLLGPTGMHELALIERLTDTSSWQFASAMLSAAPRPAFAESTARYEDLSIECHEPAPAIYAYEQPLPLFMAFARETVGGHMAAIVADQALRFVADLELGAAAYLAAAAPIVPCGKVASETRAVSLPAEAVSLPAELTIACDYPELAEDDRHSLGNDDVLAINEREGSRRAAPSCGEENAALGLLNGSPWPGAAIDVFASCGGLGVPPVTIAMQPAPAAAIDLSDLTDRDIPQEMQNEAAPQHDPHVGTKQLLDMAAVILHHVGSGLIDMADVLRSKEHHDAADSEPAVSAESARLPGDLHLGL